MKFNMRNLLFNLGVSLLLTHELDAMLRKEWVLLPVLSSLQNEVASWWFIYLHIPIFLVILYLGNTRNLGVQATFRFIVCSFLLVHAILHFSLSGMAGYDFHHLLSQLLIFGAGICGLGYLLLRALNRELG